LASNIFNKPDKKLFFINFDRVGEKVPGIFYLFLIVGWVSMVSRNFYNFSNVSTYLSDFLNSPRVLGSYTFTIYSIVIFVMILAVSFLLSRIVSFFGSDPEINQINLKKRKKISLGSWLLLVQIFIISLGLFLAIAASGVPLDKITIVMGALGVGIGLGLQGLFNNLVSGVIIAFENPVKVGDLIEIDGKPGVMKSIGFRSSVVNMFEGSSIIIPNGDLLSNQLVNWTMGRGKKVTIRIGVAYGTDLEKAVRLVTDILKNENRVLNYPMARVLPKEFAESSIEMEVTFWAHQYLELPFLRGDIISKIDVLFKKEGIVIAFPQRDLHIKSGSDKLGNTAIDPEKSQ
jgi:small-conductance mechanosensitive channel